MRPRRRLPTFLPVAAIFGIGVLTRVGAIFLGVGGVRGDYGYDASVYYAAADAFIHGRMPYQNFLLLHPPGVMYALAPFAALGNATTDLTGFVAGNLAFALIGAGNGVLVYCIARRLGLPVNAAWLGGAFYAVWAGAVCVEVSSRLEPLGSFAFLCGVLALTADRPDRNRRNAVLAGIALGFAFCVKIWWIAPLVIVAAWLWRQHDGTRRLHGFLAGAAGVVAIVDGPFFLLAPHAMARMIVLDQLGRGGHDSLAARLVVSSTLPVAVPHIRGSATAVVAVTFAGIFVAICILAWRFGPARLFVALAVMHLLILLVTPSFFATYLDFVAPPLAVTVAAAAHGRIGRFSFRPLIAVLVTGAAAITTVAAVDHRYNATLRTPTRQLAGHLPQARCVTSITPLPLIELDRLSRNLADGCRQWVDSYGRTYDLDKRAGSQRRYNAKWQADLDHYLLSGDVIVLARPDAALGRSTLRMLAHNPRLRPTYLAQVVNGARTSTAAMYTVAPKHLGHRPSH